MASDAHDAHRKLLDELDSLSAALEEAWREILPDEDPRIPVLRDVVPHAPAAVTPPGPDPVRNDSGTRAIDRTITAVIDEVIAEYLPRIEAELRARLLKRLAADATTAGRDTTRHPAHTGNAS